MIICLLNFSVLSIIYTLAFSLLKVSGQVAGEAGDGPEPVSGPSQYARRCYWLESRLDTELRELTLLKFDNNIKLSVCEKICQKAEASFKSTK